jgi:hypothetical protein
MTRLLAVCIDCDDAWPLAHWWAETLGARVRDYTDDDRAKLREQGIDRIEDDPNVAVDPIDGDTGPVFWFCEVPEAKRVKNRVHVVVAGVVDELVERGATVLDRRPEWTVMADPEGNEFCAFPPG